MVAFCARSDSYCASMASPSVFDCASMTATALSLPFPDRSQRGISALTSTCYNQESEFRSSSAGRVRVRTITQRCYCARERFRKKGDRNRCTADDALTLDERATRELRALEASSQPLKKWQDAISFFEGPPACTHTRDARTHNSTPAPALGRTGWKPQTRAARAREQQPCLQDCETRCGETLNPLNSWRENGAISGLCERGMLSHVQQDSREPASMAALANRMRPL
jgi:hypothetical protein